MNAGNWISIAALAVSLVMMYVNTKNINKHQERASKEDIKEEQAQQTSILIALDTIKQQLARIEGDVNTVKQDTKENHDKLLILEQSFKSEHKRLDIHEQRLNDLEAALRFNHFKDTKTEGE